MIEVNSRGAMLRVHIMRDHPMYSRENRAIILGSLSTESDKIKQSDDSLPSSRARSYILIINICTRENSEATS